MVTHGIDHNSDKIYYVTGGLHFQHCHGSFDPGCATQKLLAFVIPEARIKGQEPVVYAFYEHNVMVSTPLQRNPALALRMEFCLQSTGEAVVMHISAVTTNLFLLHPIGYHVSVVFEAMA